MDNGSNINFNKGIFVLSLDTELAWGMIDKPISLKSNMKYFLETRNAIDGIIELLEKYQISATWAIVGSLLLDKPKFEDEFIENTTKDLSEEVKNEYISILKQNSIWSGKDIFEKIKLTSTPQEIGSHSYTHTVFGEEKVTKEKALSEYKNGMKILEQNGEVPISFVFPRNSINYLDELGDTGFKIYRGLEPSWYANAPGKTKKACHMLDQALAITPPTVVPSKNGDLVNIPASMLYLPMNGFRKYIPLKSRVIKAQKGIQKAINEKKIFHLWFHPFNIATNQQKLLKGLEEILKMVSTERENGNLEVKTMGEIASMYMKLKDS